MIESKEIVNLVRKLEELDDAGRAAAKVAIEVLYARSQFDEVKDERKEEEGSASQRIDGTSA